MEMVLTRSEFDFGTEHRTPLQMESSQQLFASFDAAASRTLSALQGTSTQSFGEDFRFSFNGRVVFHGSRYTAYRVNTLDHLIHHRAQLGVYLRLLHGHIPAIYGPSADESPRY